MDFGSERQERASQTRSHIRDLSEYAELFHPTASEISGICVPSSQKSLDQILQGRRTISFRDFQALLSALGFALVRQRGSHRIYFHAKMDRPFPIQPDGHNAKHYQVRQLRDIVRKHGLTLDKGE